MSDECSKYDLRPIPDMEGYVISRCGEFIGSLKPRCRNAIPPAHPRKLKTTVNKDGYRAIALRKKNGKTSSFYIHNLVAAAFIGKRPYKHKVNHKNGTKLDNNVDNLEYVTHRENITHITNNKSGFTGVSKTPKRWRACMHYDGKTRTIGCFDTPEEAHAAYLAKLEEIKTTNKYAISGDKDGQ